MKNLLIKSLIFISLISLILLKIDPFFIDNSTWGASSFNALYDADENSSDIVFIGSSHLNDGIDTYIIDGICKTNSIKVCGPGMNIAQTYYNLKEVLNYQSPNIVAIETFSLIAPEKGYNNSIDDNGNISLKSYKTEYYKRFGKSKIEEISSIYPENRLFHMFNFFRFHDVWTDEKKLSKSIMTKLSYDSKRFNQDLSRRALSYYNDSQMKQFNQKNFNSDQFFISDDEKIYLNKIIELSLRHNFELLFFNVPILNTYYNKSKPSIDKTTKALKQIVSGFDNIKFYDINAEMGGFDQTQFIPGKINHNQHLNYKGMINTSYLLTQFINTNYVLETVKGDDVNAIESILYSNKKIEKDDTFFGDVSGINHLEYSSKDSIINTITHPKDRKNIAIWGWMFKNDISLQKSKRKIALKKDNTFVFISKGDLKNVKNINVPERFVNEYDKSGYSIFFDKKLLVKGKYKIFYIIESMDGEVFIKDTEKWVIVE